MSDAKGDNTWLTWARLLRLSNAPTAVADVLMGLAVSTGGALPSPLVCVLLLACSMLIYHAGMALNDAIDAQQDAAERPERPIPSGAIRQASAFRVATVMMCLGVIAAALAGWLLGAWAPVVIAPILVLTVIAYDGPGKRTPFAPLLMGACRGLNVMLGMSAAFTWGSAQLIAPGVLLYVSGLTWIASQEAASTKRGVLAWGALVSLSGIAWLAAAPWNARFGPWPATAPGAWWLLWGVVLLMIGRHYVAALVWPRPLVVRKAVGGAIQGIVVIDAALAAGYTGPFWGCAVLAMLPLTMLATRWLPQT